MNYEQAIEKLRERDSKKIGNNTYLRRREGGAVAMMLHTTDIITWKPDGTVTVDSGGYKTATTKDRLNKYLPDGFRIGQDRGIWYWYDGGERVPFTDGDSLKCGRLFSKATPDSTAAEKRLRRIILKYSKDIAAALPLEKPSGGDCWYCHLSEVETGKPLGDLTGNTSHLKAHIEESYFVPSLLYEALKEAGNGDFIIAAAFEGTGVSGHWTETARERARRAVAKYLYKRFGLAA